MSSTSLILREHNFDISLIIKSNPKLKSSVKMNDLFLNKEILILFLSNLKIVKFLSE